ncbi:endonuclease/exonuclease/phosphatase family protein [Maribacter sp.]|nr:endonuclease/exonuclease/phosphatase family protein [Maribacter sp.]
MKLRYFLRGFSIIAMLLSIFPFLPFDHWSIRVFDFPHLQLTVLTLIALLTYFLIFNYKNKTDYAFIILLASCFIFQSGKIYPYTAFASHEVNSATTNSKKNVSIYTANVLQDNDDADKLLSDMANLDADVVLYTETNEKWRSMLTKVMDSTYAYKIEIPLENTYGMLLFSKLPLYETKVRYLIEDTIPSITAKLLLPSKDTLQLFAIHPAPPTPQHNPSSVDRDAEMMKVALFSRKSRLPMVVMGDFNDVAWSETTALFQKASGLLDLRKGRGFYSTYNAKNFLMRWPLDHIFTSPDFRVIAVQRGENVGSDHYPFYVNLSYEPALADEQRLPEPTEEVLGEAFDQIENEVEQQEEEKEDEVDKG